MDFKIKIKCKKCLCSFELRPVDFKQREFEECPNCGQRLPDDVYQNLKTGVITLGSVPETIPEDSDFFSTNKQFELTVQSYNCFQEALHSSDN